MIMLDGAMFDAMLGRCGELFTESTDALFNIMSDSQIMLSSWQGIASDEFRSALYAGCDDVMLCLHEISLIIERIEDTALMIADLKHRIGETVG